MYSNNQNITSNNLSKNHWKKAPQWFDLLSSPLRPSPEDIDFLKLQVLPKLQIDSAETKKVVLLGVTPEIATLPWSEKTEILAIDSSDMMINTVWPREQVSRGKAINGNWQQLPLADNSCNLVLGDGCFTLLDYPHGYKTVLQEILRVLKTNGLCVMRFFLRPEKAEDLPTIFAQLQNKSVGNFQVFKWRLAMALQKNIQSGVPVREIWQVWNQEVPFPEKLMQELAWSSELLETINIYKDSPSVYTFPTLAEVRQLCNSDFIEESCYFPSYELGERCPTLVFRALK